MREGSRAQGDGSGGEPRPALGEQEGGLQAASDADIFEMVCRSMRRIVGRKHPDFEDLVQQAAERVIRDLPSFRGEAALSTWVFRVSYRTMLQQSRWKRRWLKRFAMTFDGLLPEPAVPAQTVDPLADTELNQRVRDKVQMLSPKLAAVITLIDLEGMSALEVSEALDVPLLTVRSRLRDARRGLAARFKKDPFFARSMEEDLP